MSAIDSEEGPDGDDEDVAIQEAVVARARAETVRTRPPTRMTPHAPSDGDDLEAQARRETRRLAALELAHINPDGGKLPMAEGPKEAPAAPPDVPPPEDTVTPQEAEFMRNALKTRRQESLELVRIIPDAGQLPEAEGPLGTPEAEGPLGPPAPLPTDEPPASTPT